jgi:hypothetical protein
MFSHLQVEASRLVAEMNRRTDVPVVGGLGGDDRRFSRGVVFANRRVLIDGLALLAASGGLDFGVLLAGEMEPVGSPGVVGATDGLWVGTIDGMPATTFFEVQSGKPLTQADLGITTLQVIDQGDPRLRYLRSIRALDVARGRIALIGGVGPEDRVQICRVRPEVLLDEVRRLGARLCGRPPLAVLMVNCAGRRWALGIPHAEEATAFFDAVGARIPLAGVASWGEIGPRRVGDGYSRALFHNMTVVLLALGAG